MVVEAEAAGEPEGAPLAALDPGGPLTVRSERVLFRSAGVARQHQAASLVRLEGQIAVATLLTRIPGLALAQPDPQWNGNTSLRGPAALPVRF